MVKTSSGAHFLRWRILESHNIYLIFFTTLRGFFHGNFLGSHNYRTHHSTNLIRYSFPLLSNSLEKQSFYFFSSTALRGFVDEFSREAIFYLFVFYFLKGFHIKEIFSKIITTEPVIALKLVFSVEEFSTDAILLFFVFRPLKGVTLKGFFSFFFKVPSTESIIVQIWSSAHFRRCQILLRSNFFIFFLRLL